MVRYYLDNSIVKDEFKKMREKKIDKQSPAYRFSLFMASENPTDFSLEELLDFYYHCP
ncbi:MAG: hypothetical protein K6G88_11160 [Lachnospiraceae bacterium]|nr:hypothetical protein [Lachnospiraceae bacterium]